MKHKVSYVSGGWGVGYAPQILTAAIGTVDQRPAQALGLTPAALAGATMGTTWSARLGLPPGVSPLDAKRAITEALDLVVAQMSTWDERSDLSRFNQAEVGWHPLPEPCFHVLTRALHWAAETGGAYDPTVGPLVNAWGFGPPPYASEPPGPELLSALRQRCGWQHLRLDHDHRRAWQKGGVCIDLSAIAKGYGVDLAAQSLARLGVHDFLMEVGGELRSSGRRPDGAPWRVAVEFPDGSEDHAMAIALQGRSIATSGDYRRYREDQMGRYAHTVDPRTGRPIANGVASVTVVHAACMDADALSTTLTVMGEQEGMDYAQSRGLAALFIVRDGQQLRMTASPAFEALLAAQ
ncbi:FAD:protein FMN transferase [Bordetella sp. 15P40C-2]|uniref:FAD:protein FMN transferase n=1 Tax=Bordetella sp. 15P40C-2 TaxID=2572246 RepID=UPI001320AB4A|nr:FAD:protein FMN transferase [Bordetella sp. 15P40C-2]MVW73057.1 FAD:protein FMN transferase [Bordetella sp. 15P40C-2]